MKTLTERDLLECLPPPEAVHPDQVFAYVRYYEAQLNAYCQQEGVDFAAVGFDGPPSAESLTFKAQRGSAVRPSALMSDGKQLNASLSFMALLGSSGVLPAHYTRIVQERLKNNDSALSEFIAIFEHRLGSLMYRAHGKYRLSWVLSKTERIGQDPFSRMLRSVSGQRDQQTNALQYAGHFSRYSRNPESLRRMLEEITGDAVRVQDLVGDWEKLQDSARLKIGRYGMNHRLGDGVMPGRRYWELASSIRVTISKIAYAKYKQRYQNGDLAKQINALCRAYVPHHISVQLDLEVDYTLNTGKRLGDGMTLGSDFWLASKAESKVLSTRRLSL